MIERRQLFGLAAAGTGSLLFGAEVQACSIRAPDRTRFSDRACRAALTRFVTVLNEAHTMTDEAFSSEVDDLGVELEAEWVALALYPHGLEPDRDKTFLRQFRVSSGKLDPRPIKLAEFNLIRRLGNRASYQFTLERYSYHPADTEGCNGLFVHDEYYGVDRNAYLATFTANRLQTIRPFPEWYL
jgi:hypothetical protein